MSRTIPRQHGFTLIELLISVAILAVIAGLALPMSELAHRRTKEEDLRYALRTIRDAIDAYKRAYDEGRIAQSPDRSGYPPTLAVLVEGVEDARSPSPGALGSARLYFLRRLPSDPFAPADSPVGGWGLRSYESPPDAPRPGRDVYDIYSRHDGRGLNGVPYREW